MLSFEIVGYAPRSPRDWYIHPSKGRDTAEPLASRLMGRGPLFRGVGKASTVVGQDVVGISVWGPVVLIIWSGTPASAFNWDDLQRDPKCQRFSVSVTPAANAMEARWEDANGQVMRHVVVSDGELVTNVGDASLVDEGADTDTSLAPVWDNRLPATTVKRLLADASEDEIKVYDRRRYVRSDDRDLLYEARIVHTDRRKRTWVAVDQTGKINTLYDPLADLSGDLDPDDLAVNVVAAWFRIGLLDEGVEPPVSRYAWPEAPGSRGLAAAIRTIQEDQSGFFDVLAASSWADADERIASHYGLHWRDVNDLLNEPLRNLLPHRPTDD
ncbi:hypothetical protein [Friedmanniella luteola]|uniref:hypothetical protein n=1 Tax=Friedmanniella luteola TaxID=546871 RepID=UPI000B83E980|nr:hypothetical protein [Friedmanniella luteola]